jgi:glycyl-tRNA synthetase
MSVLGPEFGGAAAGVADALQELAERAPSAFEGDEVTVEVGDSEYSVPTDVANFEVREETESGEHITPHVVEPSFGVDRTVYTLVAHAMREDEMDDETRTYLDLSPGVAPTDVGVFPLVSNVDYLTEQATDLAAELRTAGFSVVYDDSGSIGRRYRRQDEVGTPFCVTVDRDGLEGDGPDSVTVRERDSAAQVRVSVDELVSVLVDLRSGVRTFDDVRTEFDAVEAES